MRITAILNLLGVWFIYLVSLHINRPISTEFLLWVALSTGVGLLCIRDYWIERPTFFRPLFFNQKKFNAKMKKLFPEQ